MNIKERTEDINKTVDYHIKANDYLPTLATYILMMSAETGLRPNVAAHLAQLSYELQYLEKFYDITKKQLPAQCDLSIAERYMWKHWQSEDISQEDQLN